MQNTTVQSQLRFILIEAKIISYEIEKKRQYCKTLNAVFFNLLACTVRNKTGVITVLLHCHQLCYEFGHRFSSASQWMFSLAKHLGKT